jgi:hypothetical protein
MVIEAGKMSTQARKVGVGFGGKVSVWPQTVNYVDRQPTLSTLCFCL